MTRYDFFRKRIAPVLFLCVVGLIAFDTCEKQERHHSTIVVDLGAAEPRVRGFSAQLFVSNELVSTFERRALSGLSIGCPCKFETAMPEDHGELRFDVDLGGGVRRTFTKQLRVIEGSTTTVLLGGELDPPAR